jgi:hypothetical protein
MKRLSKYVKIAIVCAVLIPLIQIANLFFIFPLYSIDFNGDKTIAEKQIHRSEIGVHALKWLFIFVCVVLVSSLFLEFLRTRKSKKY